MRCVHEATLYEENAFITLTYDEEHLPKNGTLVLRDYQLFMKRLRKLFQPQKIRFFHCGEYGDKYKRPHYHAILFNVNFADRQVFRKTVQGNVLYTSETLKGLWPLGHSMIGSVTFESAAYVARYVMKKVTGKNADLNYVNMETGEIRLPEYTTMSRRPGIGRGYFDKYSSDIYPRDYAIMRGMKCRPPKFYDGLFEIQSPTDYSCIKKQRVANAIKIDPSGFGETGGIRLAVKEEVKLAEIRSLSRNLEA